MATVEFACGGETCFANTAASGINVGPHWSTRSGAAFGFSTGRPGSLGSDALACGGSGSIKTMSTTITSRTQYTARFYFEFTGPALPLATEVFFGLVNASGNGTVQMTSTGQVQIVVGAGVAVNLGSVVSLSTWYRVDLKFDCSGGTATLTARMDGGADVAATRVQGSAGITAVQLGFTAGANMPAGKNCLYDDITVAAFADYPLGPGSVSRSSPSSTGTHVQTAGDFKTQAAVNVTNGDTSWQNVADRAFLGSGPDLTTYTEELATGTPGGYVEYVYDTLARTIPRYVAQLVTVSSSTATANNQKAQLYDGVSAADAYVLTTVGVTTAKTFAKAWTAPPSGGAWTDAKIQALRLRWGFSTDVSPAPRLTESMLEMDYAQPPIPKLLVANQAVIRAATI